MRFIYILLFGLFFNTLNAQDFQEKQVLSSVSEATVFMEGAQILRKQKVSLAKGKTEVVFTNLSPFINAKSVRVKVNGELTVLSVNHQKNYLDKSERSDELKALDKMLEEVQENIQLENTYLTILKEELFFLKENRAIGGKNEQTSVLNLQQTADYYGKRLTALKLKEIERNKKVKSLNKKRADLQKQIQSISNKKDHATGEIVVKVDAKQMKTYSFELSYMVGNAGWYPSYDIRAKDITSPIQLNYKANVRQDTKVDWTDVKLKFSSANPSVSSDAPKLDTYYLRYNRLPAHYGKKISHVRGMVTDDLGDPLPFVNVVAKSKGTTVSGTTTDLDGNYSLTLPNYASQLEFSYIGYATLERSLNSRVINISMQESSELMGTIMLTDEKKLISKHNKPKTPKERETSLPLPMLQVENQTTVDFEIDRPYSIKSDIKPFIVDMIHYEIPASYQYYCVPKIDKDAFLLAHIVDWEKYNLLTGEANIFFEDTYIGNSMLDLNYASDTLELSLGRDKKIQVDRKLAKEYSTKKMFGSKREEIRAWTISIRNNKTAEINILILDQVPVSTNDEIEVDIQKLSGGKLDSKIGEVKWELNLKPSAARELELKYGVKFPKNKNLIID